MFANLHDGGGIHAHSANTVARFEMHVWVQSEERNIQVVSRDKEGGAAYLRIKHDAPLLALNAGRERSNSAFVAVGNP